MAETPVFGSITCFYRRSWRRASLLPELIATFADGNTPVITPPPGLS